ncbi:GNAT family N-acetyltransferase [Saccharospirillum sp. MSK14-1]|uniref:GNAT family N-acetyltransferase n=1 Tax=Saccharospirillum sp. MSK14-1 TaxID=1897632 RepID=UPI000D4843FB|nr:GNAT family N-acetyltransferase [Saccharospirillum sp. MSK14-1]PTY37458.1 GNAT family N-acetyltransferase [Saccharospirillum sp. MSK14-1]
MSDVIFREALHDDKTALLKLEQSLIEAERPFNASLKPVGAYYYDLDHLIEDVQTQLLVAEADGEVIASGYVQVRRSKAALNHDQHGYLGFMFVAENYRGQGLNKQIMQRLIDWGKDQDVSAFYLDVYSQNASAIRAYEKLGFAPTLMEMQLNLEN